MTAEDRLLCISPADGRYGGEVRELADYFSEYALIRYRVLVETEWLAFLMGKGIVPDASPEDAEAVRDIRRDFPVEEALKVKEHEAVTGHDVKAVEYYLRDRFTALGLGRLCPFIHMLLTSEDVNSPAYSSMVRDGLHRVYLPLARSLAAKLDALAAEHADVAMLSHTHGQKATPTTAGKEFRVFAYRLGRLLDELEGRDMPAKFSGTVGNFNCHTAAYPGYDWPSLAEEFTGSLGLSYNPYTTQIESHDSLCLLLCTLKTVNNVIRDLDSDMWSYISRDYFREKISVAEVGSSVMPHKVNPINYENSAANAQIANGLIDALTGSLSVSRMQRDLTDSSKMRNLGVIFAHSVIAVKQALRGLDKLQVHGEVMSRELEESWSVLAEAVQTVLRKNGVPDAYELLKAASRGRDMTEEDMKGFIAGLPLPEAEKKKLEQLTPASYTGLAEKLAKEGSR